MSFPKLAGFFKALAKPFAAISKIFLAAQTNLPFFAKLVTAFKWGFAKLAWPIQLVLSIFDFIEGWAATEGNIAEKFMGGLMNAFEKFMDLPVRLIGWIVEKVAGLFGAEVDGVAEKIMGFLKGIIEFGTAWMKPLITFFETFFTTEGTLVEKLKTSIGAFFEAWQSWIDKIIDKFAPLLKWLGIKIGTPEAATTTPATTAPETSTLDRTTTAQAKKTAAENQTQTDEVVNAINDNTKKQMDQSKKLADEQGDITAMAIGGKGGDAGPADTADKQLPDDSEIYAFLAGNNNF